LFQCLQFFQFRVPDSDSFSRLFTLPTRCLTKIFFEITICNFNIFLHKFLKSDPDDVHDHPWPYATLILKGGYWEWQPQFDTVGRKVGEYQVWRGPGSFRVCAATSYHRIELDPTIECWTMFMPGPQKREWGFLVNNKWIHNDEYIAQRTANATKH
jgi:hypothetical protein